MLGLWCWSLLSTVSAHNGPRDCLRFDRAYSRPAVPNAAYLQSEVHPIRVWYDARDVYSVSIAPTVLFAAEDSWTVQVDGIGFLPPTLPDAEDGPEFDIYLAEYYPGAAYVAADGGPDPIRGDGFNSQSSFMVIDHRLPGPLLASFVAHEFNHACQWSYDWTEFTLPLWEGTATAAEKWTLEPSYDWALPVPDFQEAPFMPVLVGEGSVSWEEFGRGYFYEYGAAMWVVWLDESFGDGAGSGGRDLWESTANEGRRQEPDVVDAFGVVGGDSPVALLAEFAVSRALTGPSWDPRGIEGADAWRGRRHVDAEALTADDLPLHDVAPAVAPFITGQAFFDIDLAGLNARRKAEIEVAVGSDSGLQSGLTVLWWGEEGSGHEVRSGVEPGVVLPAKGLERLMVAVTNGGPASWDGDDDPYVPGDQRLSVQVLRNGCGCGHTPVPGLLGGGWGMLLLSAGWAARRRRGA